MAFGLAAACGGPALRPVPPGDHVVAIRVEGNQAIDSDALVPGLALSQAIRDGAGVDPYLVTVDAERIRVAYVKRGYFAAKVTTKIERVADDAHGQIAVFTVGEGRRAVVHLVVAGLPAEVPVARVALHEGDGFDYDTYQAVIQPLTLQIQNAGYAHAEVRGSVAIDPATAIARVRYEVVAGPRCAFGAIRLPPLDSALEAAVRARLQFAPGDRYSVTALEDTQAELYALGRFSTVQLVPDRGGGTVVGVAVELGAGSALESYVGGGVVFEQTTYEPRLRGGVSFIPERVPLLTLASDLRVAATIPWDLDSDDVLPKVRGVVSAQYLDLLRPRLRGELELGVDFQTIEPFTWTGEHVKLGLASPLGARWLQLGASWIVEKLQFSSPDGALDESAQQRLGIAGPVRRAAYQASLIADLRDDPIEPRRGLYVDLRAAVGTPYALGELSYVQLAPELRSYVSFAGFVLAARARLGAIFGDVPATERYYSGGAGHRGFAPRRLSPIVSRVDDNGGRSAVVIGGAGLIETSLELRRRIGTLWSLPIGVNLFLDGGDATDTPGQLDVGRLYWAAGAGLWGKLVGNLKFRIDLGVRLNDRGADDPLGPARWSDLVPLIGIGEAF